MPEPRNGPATRRTELPPSSDPRQARSPLSGSRPLQGAAGRWARLVALAILRAYKVALSPLFAGACRFEPSCSTYAAEAISTHGLIRGGWLAARRLARCHPLGSWGHDPVPPATRVGPGRA